MNPLLYGHNPEEHIIAVEQQHDTTVRIYQRTNGKISHTDVEFFPFLFLSDDTLLSQFPKKHWIKELNGTNFFRYLCAFSRWSEMWEAVRHVLDRYNKTAAKRAATYQDLPVLHLRVDPVTQFLVQSGHTLFKGMEFSDLHRMQLDIETYARFPGRWQKTSPSDERIIIVALSDNRGWKCAIDGKKRSEQELLEETANLIREKDPDVIEGHNLYGFDLPFILRRCGHLGIDFKVGRDGSPLKTIESKPGFGEYSAEPFEIHGRHIIDTLQLLKSYDATKRNLDSYGLKYAARHFGIAQPDRTYLPGDQIWKYWDSDPDTVIAYSLDDVYETEKLSEILSPSIFYLTQMVPMSYVAVARSGSSAKIETLLLREYVREKHSVPRPESGTQHSGGYTDIFYTGIFEPVLYADIESLYPSIIISENIAPATDSLRVFPAILKQLTDMRLSAKRDLAKTKSKESRMKLDALQSSFKILINSFYGYMGYSRALFNDYAKADEVTTSGQRIVRMLMERIKERKGKVIEVDTDGMYFVPPPDVRTERDEQEYVTAISSSLPDRIRLTVNGRYKKMLSYKKKNYALLEYSGDVVIKGSSLISRSMERFGRTFVEQAVRLLLESRFEELHKLYTQHHNAITLRTLGIDDLARMEVLRETQEEYERAIASATRNRSASYESAIAAGKHWKPGDRMSYYITGTDADVPEFRNCKLVEQWDPNFRDENVSHYARRLNELAKKFEVFFLPQDFRKVFSMDDLFDFSSSGMGIVTTPVQENPDIHQNDERDTIDFPIWLDTGKAQ